MLRWRKRILATVVLWLLNTNLVGASHSKVEILSGQWTGLLFLMALPYVVLGVAGYTIYRTLRRRS